VLKLKKEVIIGIDLAGKPENPTGWALWESKMVTTNLVYTDKDILESIFRNNPAMIAIDAPLAFPKKGIKRKADEELISKGYKVFPPRLPAMRKLTERAMRMNKLIVKKGYNTIEVHPTSTRKALNMPLKDWGRIQAILKSIGLEGDLKVRILTLHEIDAVTAALTAHLHMQSQTETFGEDKEGYIVIPKKQEWSTLKI